MLIVAFRNIANAPKKGNHIYETFVSQLVSLSYESVTKKKERKKKEHGKKRNNF